MKRILNRVVSMLLVFSFCLTMGLSTTAYATDEGLESPSSVITFIDSEGKTNAVEIFCLQDGSVITKLYIEGILFGTTTTQYNEESDYIHITRIGNDGATIEKNVPRSTYVVADGIPSLSTEATVNASYNKEGTIYYNPYYGENLSIEVFTTNLGSSSHYKTFAVDAGTYVDILIGTVVNYLISIRNELSALGQEVWGMMLAASGVAVVSGIIQNNFFETFYVDDTTYNIKTKASDSGAEQYYYDNHEYKFKVEGPVGEDNWSDPVRYDYLEWDDDGVATQFFCDFWGMGNCPGISYYTYA